MARFKQMPMDPSQVMLFGLSVDEALPKDSDVRAFYDVMNCLDYSEIESKCSSTGAPPYPPKVMVIILAYAYSKRMRSSRVIENALNVDVRFIWLAGGLKPDHNTIARFRKENWQELKVLFKDSARICTEAGLVFLNAVATDGSKIRAAASKKQIYSHSRVDREMASVEKILREAEKVDLAEDKEYASGNSNELPERLKDAKERKARLEEIAARLKDSNRKAVVASEADSRVMLTGDGKRAAYNLQASVDAENQVIVAMDLTQAEDDHGQLPDMTDEVKENMGLCPDASLVDCGYSDEQTLKWAKDTGHNVLMPLQEQPQESKRKDLFASKCFLADDERDVLICPAGRELAFKLEHQLSNGTYRRYVAKGCRSCSFHGQCVSGRGSRRIEVNILASERKQMREKLKSPEGRKLYNLRRETVEPVFGQMKWNMGFDRFLLKGINGASAEAALICLVHNVMKCVTNADARAYLTRAKASLAATYLALVLERYILCRLAQTILCASQRVKNMGKGCETT